MKSADSKASGKKTSHKSSLPHANEAAARTRKKGESPQKHTLPPQVGRQDRYRAREELAGLPILGPNDTEETILRGASRDPSEPVSDYGHEIPNVEEPDGQASIERLVNEGVEEAQSDQMNADRRRKRQ